jgi:ABC-type multidrug transport system fused ATPase/permease subunit
MILYEVIFLAAGAVFYIALAIKIDAWSCNPKAVSIWNEFVNIITCRCFCSKKHDKGFAVTVPDDEDVITEQQRVESGGANNDLIVLNKLTKQYPDGKVAVNGLSLGIPPGQCFGFLGINGKSSSSAKACSTGLFSNRLDLIFRRWKNDHDGSADGRISTNLG